MPSVVSMRAAHIVGMLLVPTVVPWYEKRMEKKRCALEMC